MKINQIIKEKRIVLGLTQEQVASYLGVSTPAVNKWEKGSSYPDITLLPPLARLLKVDLNTLLSFKEDLTDKEIGELANDLATIINKDGFKIGLEKAMDLVNEYPTCHKLILNIALVLQGSIVIYNVSNKEECEKYIETLFERVLSSDDIEVKKHGISMLINKYLEKKEFDKAQEYIDKLPSGTYDKVSQQGRLYSLQGDFNKAAEVFEGKLLSLTNEIYSVILCLMDISLKENCNKDAAYFADVIEKTTKLYDLWDYNYYSAYFQLYIKEKDENNTIKVVKEMLKAIENGFDLSKSLLYKHIKLKKKDDINKTFLTAIINSLKAEINKDLSFLKDNEEFLKLLDEYSNKE